MYLYTHKYRYQIISDILRLIRGTWFVVMVLYATAVLWNVPNKYSCKKTLSNILVNNPFQNKECVIYVIKSEIQSYWINVSTILKELQQLPRVMHTVGDR